MKHIISFCIYGDKSEKKQKYRRGLLENIDTINTLLPAFNIFIAAGSDVDDDYLDQIKSTYKNIIIKKVEYSGHQVTLERYLIFDDPAVEVLFSRDADSRIDDRDIWCMQEFMKSDAYIHMIRDHKEHTMPIMAGMCGFKKCNGNKIRFQEIYDKYINSLLNKNFYGVDQQFLIFFYNLPLKKLVHSNKTRLHPNERITPIVIPLKDDVSFIGNTIDYDSSGNRVYIYKYE
jgi:hypothetical protein